MKRAVLKKSMSLPAQATVRSAFIIENHPDSFSCIFSEILQTHTHICLSIYSWIHIYKYVQQWFSKVAAYQITKEV